MNEGITASDVRHIVHMETDYLHSQINQLQSRVAELEGRPHTGITREQVLEIVNSVTKPVGTEQVKDKLQERMW